MRNTFDKALKHILQYEGGYSNHPLDPGGATNMGITHKTLARFRGTPVTKQDVKKLTYQEAAKIYRQFYWQPCYCDFMPTGIDFALFDCAVNQGVSRAVKFLQQSVKTKTDGIIGPITLAAVKRSPPKELLNEFISRRMHHYGRLTNLFRAFGLGWSRRLSAVHSTALQLILNKENSNELHS